MKKCPYCAEEIQDEAIKCKHCGEWLQKDLKDPPQLVGENKVAVVEIKPTDPQPENIVVTSKVDTPCEITQTIHQIQVINDKTTNESNNDAMSSDITTEDRHNKAAVNYFNEGDNLLQAEEYDQAILAFTKAINLDDTFAEAYNSRANAYAEKKLFDKAFADYKQAIQLMPANEIYYNNIAHTYCEKKDYNKAREYVQTMKTLKLEIHPKIINLLSAQTWKKWSWVSVVVIYAILRLYFQDWGLIFTLVYCVIAALVETLLYKLVWGKLRCDISAVKRQG